MQQPRQGDLRDGDTFAFGDSAHHIHTVEGALFFHRREVKLQTTATGFTLPVAAIFPAQQATRQRAPDHQPDAFALHHWYQFALQITSGDGVIGLQRRETGQTQSLGNAQRFGDLPRGPVRDTDVAHVAVLHQVIQGIKHLFHRRCGVETVKLVEIDMVELHTAQALFHAADNVIA